MVSGDGDFAESNGIRVFCVQEEPATVCRVDDVTDATSVAADGGALVN